MINGAGDSPVTNILLGEEGFSRYPITVAFLRRTPCEMRKC